jgi:hypothetical protein
MEERYPKRPMSLAVGIDGADGNIQSDLESSAHSVNFLLEPPYA